MCGTFGTMLAMTPTALVLVLVLDRGESPAIATGILALWLVLALVVVKLLIRPVSRIVGERRENLGLVAQGR
jgi:hypothetical protein